MFTQEHILTADSLEVNSEVGLPELYEIYVLTTSGLLIEPEVDVVSLVQGHNLYSDDTLAQFETGSPDIGQIHALSFDDILTQAPSLDRPNLQIVFELDADGLLIDSPIVEVPTFIQNHILLPIGVGTGQPTIDSADIRTTIHGLMFARFSSIKSTANFNTYIIKAIFTPLSEE